MDGLAWMLPPLALCLVLGGIHGYLGLHVLSRKVIFVDLALAQFAALGAVVATLLGYDAVDAPVAVYLVSLAFTSFGAAVFAWTRLRQQSVPQEALIGVSYATASALALLLLAKAPGESEHIKNMLAGNVLLVSWSQVAVTAAIYAGVGFVYFAFRRPFQEISEAPRAAQEAGRRVRLWDFLFYATFGVVITSSVAVAGVLLVFAFLVVPGIVAFFFSGRLGPRLVIAWSVAFVASVFGILLSYAADLPTAPSVVLVLAVLLLLAGAVRALRGASRRTRVLAGVVVPCLLLLVGGALFARSLRSGSPSSEALLVVPAGVVSEDRDPAALGRALLRAESDETLRALLTQLSALGSEAQPATPLLAEAVRREEDPFRQVELLRVLAGLDVEVGLRLIDEVLRAEPPALAERDLDGILGDRLGRRFGLGLGATVEEREAAREAFREYLGSRPPSPSPTSGAPGSAP